MLGMVKRITMSVENAQKSFKSKILRRILPTFLISATIPFIVCICIPFEIFGKNQSEFLFSFSQFVPIGILFAFLFTLVFFFALLFLPNKIYKVASAIVIALAFMLFLQGTFLNTGITTLAGDNMGEEGIPLGKSVFNLIIWIVVIAVAVVLALLKDKNGIINLAGLLLCGIVFITSLMGPVSLALTTKGVFAEKAERISITEDSSTPKVLTYKNLDKIGMENNIVIFCVDRFDQDYAEKAYTTCPEIFDELDGFIAFNDNISLYTHTFPGVANLLTNERYDPNKTRAEYLNFAYTNNKTLKVLKEKGYEINLFTASYYAYTDASCFEDYVSNVSEATEYNVENKASLSLSMMQMSLYRCFPLMFKHYLGNINSATCNDYVVCDSNDGYSQYTTNMEIAFDKLNNNGLTKSTTEKMFTFIHIDGCHDNIYDENCNKVKRGGSTMNSLKSSFKIINKYLSEMKELGVYENSTIVITGDHASPEGNANGVGNPSLTALFFKKAGDSVGDIKHNNAQVTHEELWSTIFDSEKLPRENGTSLFEIDENLDRTREYFWHNYASPMIEKTYFVNGAGKIKSNWVLDKTKTYNKFKMD